MVIFFFAFVVAVLLSYCLKLIVLINAFLLEELRDSIDMNKIDNSEDVFSFTSWDAFAIGEQFAAFVVDVLFELDGEVGTVWKGE